MKKLNLLKLLLILCISVLLLNSCKSAFFSRVRTHKVERQMAGSKRSAGKMREAPGVRRAKAAQEKKLKKNDAEYYKFVKDSREHNYEIQSDDVKARMKNNESNIKTRDKTRSKKVHQTTKKAGRKFK